MTANESASTLKERIQAKTATVGVIGLGYVGLPLVAAFGRKGFSVIGFDIDPVKVAALEDNRSYIEHFPSSILEELHGSRRFVATSDFARIKESDAVIVCVPTPLTAHREPDLSFVVSTARQIAACARPGQLIVLESTSYPGTTEEVLLPELQRAGLELDRDVFLAFSPEREDPNNPDFRLETIPKVVGGVTARSGELAALLYGSVVQRVVVVSSARVAEAAKLVENIFRSVNIALVNELKVCFDLMGIDVWEVLDAAATKPFGFMKFEPGPGLGGHCIPIDPFYLTWKAREFGFATRFIELAGEINTAMPAWVVQKLAEALNERGKSIKGSRILILGVAYKKNVDDVRESPALEIIEILLSKGADVAYHDPHVPRLQKMRRHDLPLASVALTAEAVSRSDAVVVVTDHDSVDYRMLVESSRLLLDTRAALRKRQITGSPEKLVSA